MFRAEHQPTTAESPISDHRSRFTQWLDSWCEPPWRLDSWCEPPWRALISWIVLSAIMHFAVWHSDLPTSLFDAIHHVTSQLPKWLTPLPMPIWSPILLCLMLIWFQPLLLRLDSLHSILWIAGMCPSTFIFWSGVGPFRFSWQREVLVFLSLFPGVALIGSRTRPWLILPAALCFIAVLLLLEASPSESIAYIAANIPYAAILLYGTRRIDATAEASPS